MALSLVESAGDKNWKWQPVIDYITAKLKDFMVFWKERHFVNINFPNNGKNPSALVPAFPSMRYYNDRIVTFTSPGGRLYCFADAGKVGSYTEDNVPEDGCDWREVLNGNAAVSVISSDPVCYKG
jgi:broad specificity polyphosphatase/5'/3'-nucleotidase SurE